jgi:hypothetical protein
VTGAFGIWGVGHLVQKRFSTGILLFLVGLVFLVFAGPPLVYIIRIVNEGWPQLTPERHFLLVLVFAGWLLQAYLIYVGVKKLLRVLKTLSGIFTFIGRH